MIAAPKVAGVAYDTVMIDRKLAACAVIMSWCAAASSQEVEPGTPASTRSVFMVAPAAPTRLPSTIDVGGQSLELRVVADERDSAFPYRRYVTAQVRNVTDAHARFVIAGDYIVGTIVIPGGTYRVLPATDGRPLAVHRLGANDDVTARFRQIAAPWARDLERRHVQMERLAYIRPRRVDLIEAGQHFSAEGGNFGRLTAFDAASVAAAMRDIAELTYAPDPLDLQITRVVQASRTTRVEFRQTIRGIPLFRTHELTTDADGTIVQLSTQFVDPAWATNRRVIPEQEGLAAAIEQIEIDTGSHVTDHELMNPTTLFYRVEAGHKLVPYYTFSVRPLPSGLPVAVTVNAYSREARLLVNPN